MYIYIALVALECQRQTPASQLDVFGKTYTKSRILQKEKETKKNRLYYW